MNNFKWVDIYESSQLRRIEIRVTTKTVIAFALMTQKAFQDFLKSTRKNYLDALIAILLLSSGLID